MPPTPPPPATQAQRTSNRLAEALIKSGKVTADQVQRAIAMQKEQGGQLGTNLVRMGVLNEPQLVDLLAKSFGVPSVSVETLKLDESIVKLLSAEVVRKHTLLPIAKNGARVTVAMADPTNVFALDDIKFMTGYNVEPVVAAETALRAAIDKYYGATQSIELKKVMEEVDAGETSLEVLEEEEDLTLDAIEQMSEEAPVVRLVSLVLTDAIKRGASDIHIEPYEKEMRVRYRIDGVLYEMMHPPLKLREAMTSRVKILAKLDIAEKRLPQDGRIKIKTKIQGRTKDLDYRVSSLPTIYGEKIVLRLLDKDNLMLDLTRLGFEPESLRRFENAILRPYGMVLVTGPTGSGKTNTLYSALQRINKPGVNIMTAEDPVEFNIQGINQVQMKEQIGLNFATALRSFLRQDPNIILVGEIRDFETAEVAIKAAMTGHLVLSTLHTNDAPSSISRLMNMGIEPFLVATSVHLVVAQRLVRRICTACKEPAHDVPLQSLIDLGFSDREARTLKLFHGKGCERCSGTGYKGRTALYEVMEIDDDVRETILSGGSGIELRAKALEKGMLSLRESGLCKIRDGVTSLDEVLRETVS
jgi:type IV pilus assembly protein PilB